MKHLTTSRRAVLAGFAAAATPIAPALATALDGLPMRQTTASTADAALLALKPRFDLAFVEWIERQVANERSYRKWIADLKRITGLATIPAIDWGDPDWVAWEKAARELHSGEETDDDGDDDYDAITSATDALAREVLSYRAITLEGLKLQTRALMLAYDDLTWSSAGYDDQEPENPWLHDFLESLCGVLNIPFPPIPEKARS